jgi:hypothetical protein
MITNKAKSVKTAPKHAFIKAVMSQNKKKGTLLVGAVPTDSDAAWT